MMNYEDLIHRKWKKWGEKPRNHENRVQTRPWSRARTSDSQPRREKPRKMKNISQTSSRARTGHSRARTIRGREREFPRGRHAFGNLARKNALLSAGAEVLSAGAEDRFVLKCVFCTF